MSLVKSPVGGVFKIGLSDTFVVVDGAMADELHLGDSGNSPQVGMYDVLFGFVDFVIPMPVVLASWVEGLQRLDHSANKLELSTCTFVNAYCCSGVSSALRKSRAEC